MATSVDRNHQYAMAELNALSQEEFVRVVGPVFEHSPWIAEWAAAQRPFASLEQLHGTLCGIVRRAEEALQLALIRAHPDLVGRAALAGTLTRASAEEQADAGLDQLTRAEIKLFQRQNSAYQARFGFPFVICARLNKKEAILAGFERRLGHSRAEEVKTALDEISKIAELRLKDLITN